MPAIRGNDYAKGNDGGAPVGNTNAVGNSGGPGAPPGNARAATHHGWSDPLKHYHRLAGEAKAAADELAQSAYEDYVLVHELAYDEDETDEDWSSLRDVVESHLVESGRYASVEAARDAFRTFGALYDMRFRTDISFFEDGFMVDRDFEYETEDGETKSYTQPVVNPAIDAGLRITSKKWSLREELGITHADVTAAHRNHERKQTLAELLDGEHEVIEPEYKRQGKDANGSEEVISAGRNSRFETGVDSTDEPVDSETGTGEESEDDHDEEEFSEATSSGIESSADADDDGDDRPDDYHGVRTF
jgi:hypothetical protein